MNYILKIFLSFNNTCSKNTKIVCETFYTDRTSSRHGKHSFSYGVDMLDLYFYTDVRLTDKKISQMTNLIEVQN